MADNREDPPGRSRLDTPLDRPPGAKVYEPHYSAKKTTRIESPSAFGAVQDLRAELKLRFDHWDKIQRDNEERFSELERTSGAISHNDLSQAKELADALIRVKKLEEELPKATGLAVERANAKQTIDLKSSKLTEYLRLVGVVIGTALASYFASYKGSSEAPKSQTVVVQPPSANPPSGL